MSSLRLWVVKDLYRSFDELMVDVDDYLSRPHDFTVTAEIHGGEGLFPGTLHDTFRYLPPHVLNIDNRVEAFSEISNRTL